MKNIDTGVKKNHPLGMATFKKITIIEMCDRKKFTFLKYFQVSSILPSAPYFFLKKIIFGVYNYFILKKLRYPPDKIIGCLNYCVYICMVYVSVISMFFKLFQE